MATICVAVLLASWVGAVIAQVDQRLVTWASVSVVYHGEKMPVLSDGLDGALTPLGAKQAYDAGSFLRGRYLVSAIPSRPSEYQLVLDLEDLETA